MLQKMKDRQEASKMISDYCKEARRMIKEYEWEDRETYPYDFPMKLSEVVDQIEMYPDCTPSSQDYLITLANGLAMRMNRWAELAERRRKIGDDMIDRVREKLSDIAAEVGWGSDYETIAVTIEWGDWKHDHLRAKHLMKQLGFDQLIEIATEEDGSDCYSSIHYFTYDGI